MNAEEFKQQFYPFHPKLYRIAYVLLNNADDAEDILQDLYYKLWNKRDDLAAVQQPEAYCITLIKNLCMDFLRLAKNRINSEDIETLKLATDITPESELESEEKIGMIDSLINRLPVKQQIVIRLRGCGDCTLEEIETVTGESPVHVRVLLSRARKTLKDMLVSKQMMKE